MTTDGQMKRGLAMANYAIEGIKGVIPALITCFDENEEFDGRRMRAVVAHLLSKGVNGLYLTGSTGETFLMTPEERKKVVETVIDEVAGRVPVIVHVGAIGTRLSIDLARHAYEAGADAVSSVPPFYWRFNDDSIFNYYKDITEATPLPMIIYNIALAGVMGIDTIFRLASIRGVVGMKYTGTAHHEIMRIKNGMGRDFHIYSGADEMALSGLLFGACGVIGSFYNIIPELFTGIYDAILKGDMRAAQEKQAAANEIILLSLKYDYFSVMKRVLAWMGIDAGYCRRPFANLSEELELTLKEEFRRLKAEKNITGVEFLELLG